jgi:replicative DNA helicase
MVAQFKPRNDDSRTPPHNLEAEEAVIGGILLDPNAIARVSELLKPADFYFQAHQNIFRAAIALSAQGVATDMIQISTWLNNHNLLESSGGRGRIISLVDGVISAVNIDQYASLIVEKSKRRSLIQTCAELTALAQDSMVGWEEVRQTAEAKVFLLSESASKSGLRPVSEFVASEVTRIEQLAEGVSEAGIMTGFYDLDAMTTGFKSEELVICAGRPAMGKSAFVGSVARNVAAQGHPVALFSLEMSGGSVARRLLSAESVVPNGKLTAGKDLTPADWVPLGQSIELLSHLALAIDDSESVTPSHVLSQCRRLKAEQGSLGLVIVDYLHLMLDGGEDDVRELGKITRAFKRMARSLGCPILLLSQLSRAVEGRTDKRPTMADLRSSGAIEQDADVVLMLYRDEYYNENSPDRGIAEIIIRKNRNGPIGTTKLLFEPHYSRFLNLRSQA